MKLMRRQTATATPTTVNGRPWGTNTPAQARKIPPSWAKTATRRYSTRRLTAAKSSAPIADKPAGISVNGITTQSGRRTGTTDRIIPARCSAAMITSLRFIDFLGSRVRRCEDHDLEGVPGKAIPPPHLQTAVSRNLMDQIDRRGVELPGIPIQVSISNRRRAQLVRHIVPPGALLGVPPARRIESIQEKREAAGVQQRPATPRRSGNFEVPSTY